MPAWIAVILLSTIDLGSTLRNHMPISSLNLMSAREKYACSQSRANFSRTTIKITAAIPTTIKIPMITGSMLSPCSNTRVISDIRSSFL